MQSDSPVGRCTRIADYALSGDCHGTALVRRDGSIDGACLTRFDSGGVFRRMLDSEKGGAFELAPRGPFESTRRYLPDTNYPQAFTHIAQINAAEQLRNGRTGHASNVSLGDRARHRGAVGATSQHAASRNPSRM